MECSTTSPLALSLALVLSLGVPSAQAGDKAADPLAEAAYLLARGGGAEQAAEACARRLNEDPTDPRAHYLYVTARTQLHDDEVLRLYYKSLAEAEDAAEAIRAARVLLIAQDWDNEGDCEEFDALLNKGFIDPGARAVAGYAVLRAHNWEACRKKEQLQEDLERYAPGPTTPAWGHGLWLSARLSLEPVNAGFQGKIGSFARQNPTLIRRLSNLWGRKAAGTHLEESQRVVLREAKRAQATGDKQAIHGAVRVFAQADDPARTAAEDALRVADPSWEGGSSDHKDKQALRKASKRYRPADALDALDEAGASLPETGEARALYQELRAETLLKLERPQEALESYRKAVTADPNDPDLANEYAWKAALEDEDLETALETIERGIDTFYSTDWPDRSWKRDPKDWRETLARSLSNSLDTKGWILHGLERNDEAAAALLQALLLREGGVFHTHLGLVQRARGKTTAAVTHISRGLALGTHDADLTDLATRALEEMAPTAGLWLPEGADGWVDAHRLVVKAADAEASGATDGDDGEEKEEEAHPLVGQLFPDLEFEVGGTIRTIGSFEGPLVVDLWATWCGPCVKALPHLEELAETYEGATFLALSVDSGLTEVEAFFGDALSERPFVVAWGGDETMGEVQIRGIPAVFIMDEEHRVTALVQGYQTGDTRIDEAVAAVLGIEGEAGEPAETPTETATEEAATEEAATEKAAAEETPAEETPTEAPTP